MRLLSLEISNILVFLDFQENQRVLLEKTFKYEDDRILEMHLELIIA